MAKVVTVQKARASKKTRKCRRCGHEIQAGEPYKYVRQRVGYTRRGTLKLNFCGEHYPKGSELASGRRAQLMGIQDAIAEGIQAATDTDSISSMLTDAASSAEEMAGEYEESVSNIEEGFGHPISMSEEMQEKADAFNEWASVLENAANEIQGIEAGDEETDDDILERAQEIADSAASELSI